MLGVALAALLQWSSRVRQSTPSIAAYMKKRMAQKDMLVYRSARGREGSKFLGRHKCEQKNNTAALLPGSAERRGRQCYSRTSASHIALRGRPLAA